MVRLEGSYWKKHITKGECQVKPMSFSVSGIQYTKNGVHSCRRTILENLYQEFEVMKTLRENW